MDTTSNGAGNGIDTRGDPLADDEARETRAWLEARERTPASTEEAIAVFDRLPRVTLDELQGAWRGAALRTEHPFDGLLESFGWYGKLFPDAENVHPLVFTGSRGERYSLNASLLPSRLLSRLPITAQALSRRALGRRLGRRLGQLSQTAGPLLRTTKPTARLRMLEHRGVVTATMLYDALPIHDIYRKVDDDTVMGWMDMRGLSRPFFFALHRDPAPGPLFEALSRGRSPRSR